MGKSSDHIISRTPWSQRCTATAKGSGQRCQHYAIRGGTVCYQHGGAAPQVKRKAAERLTEARDLAIERLKECLSTPGVEPKVLLEACVKLTELTETLEGRVSNRTEVITPDAVEAEIARLEAQFADSE